MHEIIVCSNSKCFSAEMRKEGRNIREVADYSYTAPNHFC